MNAAVPISTKWGGGRVPGLPPPPPLLLLAAAAAARRLPPVELC
jgi:hypothetical protein